MNLHRGLGWTDLKGPLAAARACGDCQLCCTLLPTRELDKGANTRCKHQRFGKGCTIYDRRPAPCVLWSCRWLTNDDAHDLRRPDRSGYVIDIMPDYVTIQDNVTGAEQRVEVVQVWCDPKRRTAYRDAALLAWLERKWGESRALGLVRFSESEAIVLVPPAANASGEWREVKSPCREPQHTAGDIARAVGLVACETSST